MNSGCQLTGPPERRFVHQVLDEVQGTTGLRSPSLRWAIRGAIRLHYRLIPTFPRLLHDLLQEGESVLDVGCGKASPLRFTDKSARTVGVDIFLPYLLQSKAARIHDEYILGDLRSFSFSDDAFDTVLSLNVIEHLTRADGRAMLRKLERWARERVIIYTSNGFRHQEAYDDNPSQEHISGWGAEEFEALGYRVFGVGGWRRILRFKRLTSHLPKILWNAICNASGLLIARNPAESIDVCCVKDLN